MGAGRLRGMLSYLHGRSHSSRGSSQPCDKSSTRDTAFRGQAPTLSLNEPPHRPLGPAPGTSLAVAAVAWLRPVPAGTDQRGFKSVPIQLIVAVSDKGMIRRRGGWEEPREPLRVFVTKADLVADKIRQELERHSSGANGTSSQSARDSLRVLAGLRRYRGANGTSSESARGYGKWSMKAREVELVAEFLAARHVDRSDAPPVRSKAGGAQDDGRSTPDSAAGSGHPTRAVCSHCGSEDLTARWGEYGYYWRCGRCEQNTAMPVICSACGTEGGAGENGAGSQGQDDVFPRVRGVRVLRDNLD